MDELRRSIRELQKVQRHTDLMSREAINVYRPMHAKQERVHHSGAKVLLVSGGKRSGKTVSSVIEFASRVLGHRVLGMDGEPIKGHWPHSTPEDPRQYWIIGWDVKHLGQTLYPRLFEPGLFKVIKDDGQWRIFNESDPADAARANEARPSEPVIPRRLIDTSFAQDGFAWESRAMRVFSECRLKNGAILRCYPSSSRYAKPGEAVDGIWIDEDVQYGEHVDEWLDRTTSRGGWLLWSVWPQDDNLALQLLMEECDRQAEEEVKNPRFEKIQLLMTESTMISEENKRNAVEAMRAVGGDEAVARRDRGELMIGERRMYDYIPNVHDIVPLDSEMSVALNKFTVLRKSYKELSFPASWTRYLSIDPSHTRTAVLCGVVPPPEVAKTHVGNALIIESEWVQKNCTAETLAEGIKAKWGHLNIESFVIDRQFGQQSSAQTGARNVDAYMQAFAKYGLRSRSTSGGFDLSCNIPSIRYEVVRRLLAGYEYDKDLVNQRPKWPILFICPWNCPQTIKEFRSYKKTKERGDDNYVRIVDHPSPATARRHDCMQALEFLCALLDERFQAGTAYVAGGTETGNPFAGGVPSVLEYFDRLEENHSPDQGFINVGPPVKSHMR